MKKELFCIISNRKILFLIFVYMITVPIIFGVVNDFSEDSISVKIFDQPMFFVLCTLFNVACIKRNIEVKLRSAFIFAISWTLFIVIYIKIILYVFALF